MIIRFLSYPGWRLFHISQWWSWVTLNSGISDWVKFYSGEHRQSSCWDRVQSYRFIRTGPGKWVFLVCRGGGGVPGWRCPSRKPLPLSSIDLVCWESPVHRPLLLQSQRLPETFLRSFQLDQLDFNGLKRTPVNSYFPPPLLGKWINERSDTIVYYIVILYWD